MLRIHERWLLSEMFISFVLSLLFYFASSLKSNPQYSIVLIYKIVYCLQSVTACVKHIWFWVINLNWDESYFICFIEHYLHRCTRSKIMCISFHWNYMLENIGQICGAEYGVDKICTENILWFWKTVSYYFNFCYSSMSNILCGY